MLPHSDGSWKADQQKRQNVRVDPIRKMTEGLSLARDCFEFGS